MKEEKLKEKNFAEIYLGDLQNVDSSCLTLANVFLKCVDENEDSGIYFYNKNGQVEYRSYVDIREEAKKIFTGLNKKGVKAKEKVIFQFSKARDFVETFWACTFSGVIPAPITIPQVLDVNDVGSKLIYNTWRMMGNAKIIVSDDIYEDYVEMCEQLGIEKRYIINLSELRNNEPAYENYPVKPEDPAIMFFTSGSTGMPKGVIQNNEAVVKRQLGVAQLFKDKKDISLNWMPLEHAGGILMSHFRGIMLGGTQIQVETEYILEDPLRWLDLIDKYRVEYSWAPHFAYALINEKLKDVDREWDLSCVKHFLNGGEMINAKGAKYFVRYLKKYKLADNVMLPAWGMAETCSGTIYNMNFTSEDFTGVQIVGRSQGKKLVGKNLEDEEVDVITEIGVPIPGMAVRITDTENNILKEDEIGRVLIKGNPVTEGYYNNSKANEETFTDDGWFITGDLGFVHNKQLVLTGREKDVIIVNGLNYNNVEIESVVEELKEVETSYTAVCSVMDPKTKEDKIIIFFVPKDGVDKEVVCEKIYKYVIDKIRLKVDHVLPVLKSDIPKTNLGKIQRTKLGKKFDEGGFDNLLVKEVDKYNCEIERIEEELSGNKKYAKIAIIPEKLKEEINVISIEDIKITNKKKQNIFLEESGYDKDIKAIASSIEGVKNGLVETFALMNKEKRVFNVFFVPEVNDFKFSMIVAHEIKEDINEKLDIKVEKVIPISEEYFKYIDDEKLSRSEIKSKYEEGIFNETIKRIDLYLKNENTIPDWFYEENLVKCDLGEVKAEDNYYLVFCDSDNMIKEIFSNSSIDSKNIINVVHGEKYEALSENRYIINQFNIEDYFRLFESLKTNGVDALNVIHLWSCQNKKIEDVQELKEVQYDGPISILNIVQMSKKSEVKINGITVVTLKSLAIGSKGEINYANSTLSGYIKAAADENIPIKQVDIDLISEKVMKAVLSESNNIDSVKQVIYREGERFKISLKKIDIIECANREIPLKEQGYYIITGGLGGVALEVAKELIDEYSSNIVLIGRSNISSDVEKQEVLSQLMEKAKGVSFVRYESCDITDKNSVENIINKYSKEFNKQLDGIFHFAGIIQENLIINQTADELFDMYNAKVFGTWVIGETLKKYKECIFVATSSARTLLPGMTVSSYCSGNEFEANYVQSLNNTGRKNNYCLSWTIWDEVGMSKGLIVKKSLEEKGFKAIKTIFGINSLKAALKLNKQHVFIGLDESKSLIMSLLGKEPQNKYKLEIYCDYKDCIKYDNFLDKIFSEIESSKLNNLEKKVNYLVDIPVDKNGSVDKNVLLNRMDVLTRKKILVKPESENEKAIYAMWEKIFGNSNFGIKDNFFEIGGDSIKIIQLSSSLKDKFNKKINYFDLFKTNTIQEQAKLFPTISLVKEDDKDEKIAHKEMEVNNLDMCDNAFELSSAQKRQWVMYELDADCPNYNNTVVLTVNGQVIVPCLKMAIYQLIERHDTLRTKFKSVDGVPYQVVDESIDLYIDEIDLQGMDEEEQKVKLEEIYYKEVNKVMNITLEYPIRVSLIYLNRDKIKLLISIHHIVSDGWSMRVLLQDLSVIYEDIIKMGYSRIPKLSKKYSDFVAWEKKFLSGNDFEEQLSYWKSEFEGDIPYLNLPFDKKRPEENRNLGKRLIFDINQETTKELKDLANEKGCTLYMLLMSAFTCLLQRYTSQEDIILGTLIANRQNSEFEKMIGFFVNTLPIKLKADPQMDFGNLVDQVKTKTLKMYDNQYVPFDVLINKLQVKREANTNPLFQVLFVVQNAQIESIKSDNLLWNLEIKDSETCKFDFSVQIFQIHNKLSVKFEYNCELFEDETIQRWKEHFERILKEITKDSNKKIGEYDFISNKERNLISDVNNTKRTYESNTSIYELFNKVKEKNLDKIAVTFKDENITYGELNARVNGFADYLYQSGVKKQDSVAIVTEKSINLIIAILATIKIGAIYVPVSDKYPEDLVDYIINDSNTKVMICNINYSKCDYLKKIDINKKCEINSDDNTIKVNCNDIAYVMYTSGSTGKPKGVLVTHKNIIRLVNNTNFIDFKPLDVILQTGSLTFDASTFEVWGALLNGLKLQLVEEEVLLDVNLLREEIVKSRASIMWITSPLFNQLSEINMKLFDGIRVLLVGGDVLSPKNISNVKNACRGITIINGYGPTENTTFSTTYKIDKNFKTSIPIGRPIANSTAYILNENFNLQPVGVVGELCVGGDGVAKGYLNRDNLNKEKFIDDPFNKGNKLYRTGDYAKLMKDGSIYFIGRVDHQVKIRGFRIELQAIEQEINNIEGVKRGIVCCKDGANGDKKIVAYIAGKNKDEVLKELKEKLPSYMIPAYFVQVDNIPLTHNGKVDISALPEPNVNLETNYESPRNDLEQKIADVWAEVLGIKKVGINDNFFEVGGDSIKAIQIVSRLSKYNIKLETRNLLKYPFIKDLIKCVEIDTKVEKSNEVIEGKVECTPIQKWFFKHRFEGMNHFNQSMIIYNKDSFDENLVRKTFSKITEYHDALRMKYDVQDENVIQYNKGIKEGNNYSLEVIELYDQDDYRSEILKEEKRIQESIDLKSGPLVKLALFKTKEGDHLLITIHHLVVDGVSWRIILEDFKYIYLLIKLGKEVQMPNKTTSYMEWAKELKEYVMKNEFKKERSYWKNVVSSQELLDVDKKVELRLLKDSGSEEVKLSKEYTNKLLTGVNKAYNTEINDILLTALGASIKLWKGINNIIVNLEGHGREEIIKDVDITRTVGWFTSQYPVLLDMKNSNDIPYTIKTIKEYMRCIPQKGISYQMLKYSDREDYKENLDFKEEISFNYLGQFDEDINTKLFANSSIIAEHSITPNFILLNKLNINGKIINGHLEFTILYNKKEYKEESILKFTNIFKSKIEEIIRHCIEKDDTEKTPSDFGCRDLSLNDFDKICDKYNVKNIDAIYNLTPMQEGMLFHALKDKESVSYFEQISIDVEGKFNLKYMQESFNMLLKKHDVLRTVFVYEGIQKPRQVVLNNKMNEVYFEDISNLSDKNEIIAIFKEAEKMKGFDLSNDSLIKLAIFKIEENKYTMVWNFHHIILDGWCLPIIFNTYFENYKCLEKKIEKSNDKKQDYIDYINWIEKQNKEDAKIYWQKYLEGYDTLATIPVKKVVSSERIYDREEVIFELDENLTEKLKTLASKNKVTLNTVCQSIWGILLQRYNNSEDVVFGSVVSGRTCELEEIEKMVGLFINTIPIRVKSNDKIEFKELLHQVQQGIMNAQNFAYYPLAEIQSVSGIQGALLNHVIAFENYPVQNNANDDGSIRVIPNSLDVFEQSSYDMGITIVAEKKLAIKFMFNANVYDIDFIKNIENHFKSVVKYVIDDESVLIRDIEIVSGSERDRILKEFNKTVNSYNDDILITELFERQVDKNPEKIAIVYEDKSLTYKELNEKANQLARLLRSNGVKPNDIVGIMCDRSIEVIVGIFAVIKAGGSYLPIDVKYPAHRIKYIINDSNLKILLVNRKMGIIRNDIEDIKNINIIDLSDKNNYLRGSENLSIVNSLYDTAYVIYTSGSTGLPKGVLVNHKGLTNILTALQENYPLKSGDTYLFKTTYTFDVSVTEIFGWIFDGGRLAILPSGEEKNPLSILQAIDIYNVTHINFVPAMLSAFLNYIDNIDILRKLKYIFCAGEAISIDLIDRLTKFKEGTKIINLYGPTEATIYSTEYNLKNLKDTDSSIPIGKPVKNMRAYVINSYNNLQPIGVVGELCMAGVGVSKGYINKKDLTEKKFIKSPFNTNEIMYKTGDLAKYLNDGNISFVGRVDDQIKVRGFRIELGEIENCILKNSKSISDVAVIAKKDKSNNKYLEAYFVSKENLSTDKIRKLLLEKLPNYMVPTYFKQLKEIPMNNNGKVDRTALANLQYEQSNIKEEYLKPKSELGKKLAKIWSEVLGIDIDRVGVNDNFFEIGGHSLHVISVISKIYNDLGIRIPLNSLYINETISKLAIYIEDFDSNFHTLLSESYIRFNYEKDISKKKIFCFPPILGSGTFFKIISSFMTDYCIYSFDFIKENDRINHYVNKIKEIQPNGPYVLMGYSAGGNLAFEVAKKLEEKDEEVSEIIMIDSFRKSSKVPVIIDEQEIKLILEKFLNQYYNNEDKKIDATMFMDIYGDIQRKYTAYFSELINYGKVKANIHLIKSTEKYSIIDNGWSEYTTSSFYKYSGIGKHEDMLIDPINLKYNMKIINKILYYKYKS